MSADLHARVDNAIARVTARVMAEITTTYMLVPLNQSAEVASDVDQIARIIWVNLNDQRKAGTFGFQSQETQRPYLAAAVEIYEWLMGEQS